MSDENASEIFISAFLHMWQIRSFWYVCGKEKKHTSYIIMPPVCVILYVKID